MGRSKGGNVGRSRRSKREKEDEEEEDDEGEEEEDEDEDDEEEDSRADDEEEDDEDGSRGRRRSARRRSGRTAQYTFSSGGSESDESSGGREKRKGGGSKKTGKARRELPPGAVAILKQWLLSPEHVNHPYPTPQDQQQLMAATGIDKKQLKNWFTNARRRIWKPMMRKQQEESGVKDGGDVGGAAYSHPHRHHGHMGASGNAHGGGHHHGSHQAGYGSSHHHAVPHHQAHAHHPPAPPPATVPANQSATGGLQKVSSIGSMLALSGFTSVDDFFKSFFNDPSPSPGGSNAPANGTATAAAGPAASTVPQPGMHPLVNAFKSSRSFSNLRAASVTDFPRTDSYAFLEVFFNDEGLEGLGSDSIEAIGLSMDGDGASNEASPTVEGRDHQNGGVKRQASDAGATDGMPNGKRVAGHVAFAAPPAQEGAAFGQQPQAQAQQGTPRAASPQLMPLMQPPQPVPQQQQQPPPPPPEVMAPPASVQQPLQPVLSPSSASLPQVYFPPFKSAGSVATATAAPPFGAQPAFAAPAEGVEAPLLPQQQAAQQPSFSGPRASPSLPQAVHVSTAARCPFCPELNVDTQLRPCGHLFHGNCLKPWLEEAQGPPGCPVCSSTISSCVLAIPCINTTPHQVTQGRRGQPSQHHGPEDAAYHVGARA